MEVIALDHVYLSVADLARSERFYDEAMRCLGFRKGTKAIAGEPHAHYFNRALRVTIRPARGGAHDPYAPGLHHLCLQVPAPRDVDAAHRERIAKRWHDLHVFTDPLAELARREEGAG